MNDAVHQTTAAGSSTCLIVELDADKPEIHTANIGDGGYLLLRRVGIDLVV